MGILPIKANIGWLTSGYEKELRGLQRKAQQKRKGK